ncbi:MAG TPA: nicotinate phosphoribosyltransferase [Bryobacteraceae bacterium]|nr:nicotinate phosphoribosyltransferase [Bryobacteraceae bacterium]
MSALHTDLYQLTMAAGYFESGRASDVAVFELFVRRLPANRDFLIAAGLQQAVEYLVNLRFDTDQIKYLRTLPQFQRASPNFWDYLVTFRFTGDLFAMPEGTPFFAGEPIAIVRAPIIEAQVPETYLLSMLGYQSMIAAKAWRVVSAAQGRSVVEFGSRRGHGPDAGVLAGRAAYIAGCDGTSNVESGYRYGIPVFGTSAHSWVLSFAAEVDAYRHLQELLGPGTVYLIDSYDTLEGARKAVELGKPLWGVRLDSGDLAELSRKVRTILDEGGLPEAKIMATNDLNENRIRELVAGGAPIDSFGVGTDLTTSADAPALSVVYKLVEVISGTENRYVAKYSADKRTYPAAKQIFRYRTRDIIGVADECGSTSSKEGSPTALLQPVILQGKPVEVSPVLSSIRTYCAEAIQGVSASHSIGYSSQLTALAEKHRASLEL